MATINGSYQKVQNISGELDTLHLSAVQALSGRTVVDPVTGVTAANPRGFLGFFGATPIVQPDDTVTAAAFVENAGGTAVNEDSTFGGYTLGQVVAALQDLGLLAS